MLRYYITDRLAAGGHDALLRHVARAAATGVDFVQVREKDLSARALLALTSRVLSVVHGSRTRVLVNDRLDVALAAGAHGVHMRSRSVPVEAVRAVAPPGFLIGVSCHTAEEVASAQAADLLVLGPVFGKAGVAPLGLARFGELARGSRVPVLALGGVTWENAEGCLGEGAAGVAGIGMFQAG